MYIKELTSRVTDADWFNGLKFSKFSLIIIFFNDYIFWRKTLAAPNNHQEDLVKKKLKSD